MSDSATQIDFVLDEFVESIDDAVRIESLLGSGSMEQFRRVCFTFADEHHNMTVGQLRLLLQVEDHLDWLLRQDLPRLQLWRLDTRRKEALAIGNHIADMWQALGVCLGRYALGSGEWLTSSDEESGLLPLTIAVALHCHVNEIRWRARGERPCDVPLRALHRLYAIAESRNIAEQEVYPYEADVDFSITPKGQYVLMLLMADLAERELPPVQRLVAQHWLNSWSQDVVLDSTLLSAKHSTLVDLDSSEGIQRITESTRTTFRYLDIRAIAKRIEEADAQLANSTTDDDMSRELVEATEADFADTLAWLEKLYHDRSGAFQTTRAREQAPPDRFARVVVGWNQIQDFVEASSWETKAGRGTFGAKCPSRLKSPAAAELAANSAGGLPVLDPQFASGGEKRDAENFVLWRTRDVSAGGLGLSPMHAADAELAVGTLLLVAMEGENHWSLGRIVRKFKALDENDTRFGIQLIGQDAVPVRLTPRQPEDQGKNTLISSVIGLFMCRPDQADKQDLLLISSTALAYTRRYELKTGNKRLPIRTAMPVQSAGAWALIQFEEDI